MVPRDDFTPYGYLDNPYHSWKLNPSGVLRSMAPLGMGWHVPNLGSYANNQFQYAAHLTIGLNINDLVLVTPDDFRRHKCSISSTLHSKTRFEYSCVVSQYELTLTARYFLVNEHTLGCMLKLSTTFPASIPITCYLIHRHVHNPHTSRLWEHGLYALRDRQYGYALLGLASEGDAFVHGGRADDDGDGIPLEWGEIGFATSLEEISAWAKGARVQRPNITQRVPDTGHQHRALALPCNMMLGGNAPSECVLHAVLARGVSQDQAIQGWEEGLASITQAEEEHRADDEVFWQQAPQLSGAWPANWRHGLVYDLEMLRMIMRPPAGVVPHPWDGMQIQAPRLVLAEAAMDALFLSYADPDLAAQAILGHFEHAQRPNLPCMREDGSYNMVADDGQICGTAPEWGFPLWCLDQILRRTGDLVWLGRLYTGAAAFLRWWLQYRSDGEGWLGYACSWESGQDVSTRFGAQQTGGSIIQHVRPVDLQASMAQGAEILARWAGLLMEAGIEVAGITFTEEIEKWRQVAEEYTIKTRLMWRDGWFRDYDSVAKEWSNERDAMHLAPVFCGVAARGHVEQLRSALAQPPSNNPYWRPLSWPPIIMTVVEAARAAGMHAEAAELAYRFIDASYRSIDSRAPDEYGNIPGITRENRRQVEIKFGVDYVNSGIEGYGWGAVNIHLLIRHLLGMYATDLNSINLAPTLPIALRRPGATYTIAPIPWGKYLLSLICRVKSARSYEATFHVRPRTQEAQPAEKTEARLETVGEQEHHWEGTWGEERTFLLAS